MRPIRLLIPIVVLSTALSLQAKEVFVAIAGSVGVFKTDARIVNPSSSKDITVNATLLPVCALRGDGSTDCPATTALVTQIAVPKRSMKVLDDVVAATLNSSGITGIRLATESDDFTATARIFAATGSGTLGQFENGLQASEGIANGVIQQLKVSDSFRTNIGMLNPTSGTVTVTMKLHDVSAVVATRSITLSGGAVIGPTSIPTLFNVGSSGLTDCWVSYVASSPIIAYGSVVDNTSTDPTFIPALPDSGSDPNVPQPKTVTVDVGPGFSFSPANVSIHPGDTVNWVFHSFHNTVSNATSGVDSWESPTMGSGSFSHKFDNVGTFPYYCSLHSTPTGTSMNGVVSVAP